MEVAPLRSVQQNLGPDQVLLEYVLAEPQSYCLVITRERIHIVTLADRQRIETAVDSLLKEFKAKKAGKAQAAELFDLLLRDIPEARKERWIIVPDGRLHLLPFEALRDTSGRYVVSSHVVSYAPSATAMYLMSRATGSQKPPQHTLLAVGGIPYEQRTDLNNVAVKAGYVQAKLAELPGSKQEVMAVEEALHGTNSRLLVGDAATESAFKNADLDQYEIIHLAVHGVANEKHPEHQPSSS